MEKGACVASAAHIVLVPAEPDPYSNDGWSPTTPSPHRRRAYGRSFNSTRHAVYRYGLRRTITSTLRRLFIDRCFNGAGGRGAIAGLVWFVHRRGSGSCPFEPRYSILHASCNDRRPGGMDWFIQRASGHTPAN